LADPTWNDPDSDFLLVVLRDMVHTYPEMRIILMSATIDTTLFSSYFGNCPIVEVEGSAFPVQVWIMIYNKTLQIEIAVPYCINKFNSLFHQILCIPLLIYLNIFLIKNLLKIVYRMV
jgi:hypothetical protein